MGKTIKIEIKNKWTGSVLFEYESEDNTIKKTVEEAMKRGADLRDAYLGGADLRGADLRGADLGGADLGGADLGDADLGDAYLGGAYLGGAYLGGADLRGADLRGAYLGDAYLGGAYLRGADLRGADLGDAYLRGAYLRGADLRGAYLGGADIKLLSGNSIFRISDIGSRMGTTYAYNTDKGIYVQCGCFFGTLDEFAAKVEQTHGDNLHGKVYKAIIEVIKLRFAEE